MNETLMQVVKENLKKESSGNFQWEPILHGGSDREFFRIRNTEGRSWVAMQYSNEREENKLYVGIARFMGQIRLNVPRVFFHDETLCLIIVEDLGEVSLHQVFHEQETVHEIESLYNVALDQIRQLHQHTEASVPMMHGFDQQLYHWERTYFLDNLVIRWADIPLTAERRAILEAEGEKMATGLLQTLRCLIHRDFQSQNLMVRDGAIWLIDFQGMRPGHAAYDVASLLYDPYTNLPHSTRASLLEAYATAAKKNKNEFEDQFYRAAAQRLMQALGAYGYLGLVKEKRNFLKYIAPGLERLSHVLERLEGMEQTLILAQECLEKCSEETKVVGS